METNNITSTQLEACILWACEQEVSAPKPGNVNLNSDGHNMVLQQFLDSAKAIAPVLSKAGDGVGERILAAIEATREVVDTNTNLGIVLLFAPLCQAALQCKTFDELQPALIKILDALTVKDAEYTYRAIQLAEPGGMGKATEQDISEPPTLTLKQAMALAKNRDTIAAEYANHFNLIFSLGLPSFIKAKKMGETVEWSAVFAYLMILSHAPDTLIRRKFGDDLAQNVADKAAFFVSKSLGISGLSGMSAELTAWDTELKEKAVNPGTSADLTAAMLLLVALQTEFAKISP